MGISLSSRLLYCDWIKEIFGLMRRPTGASLQWKAMTISSTQQYLLLAIAGDNFLKAHRDIEGNKTYLLHPLQGEPETVEGDEVQGLVNDGFIDSNKKFPAATFWLTEKGKQVVAQLRNQASNI
jgi:hypothetical protein